MSAYPFPHIECHKSYEITFLESVIAKLTFNGEGGSYDILSRYLDRSFGAEISKEKYDLLNADPIRLSNGQRSMAVKIYRNAIELFISGKAYTNFQESVAQYIISFAGYLTDIGSVVNQLSLEMIDVWPFQNNVPIDMSIAIPAFFSEGFIRRIGFNPNAFSSKEFRDDSSGDFVVVKYGCVNEQPDNPSRPKRLILDTMALTESTLEPEQLLDAASRLNNALYDVFHWAVSDNVIKAMINPKRYEGK